MPHLVPQVRGLLATCHVELSPEVAPDQVQALLREAYKGEPFVHVVDAPPSTKLAWGTNHAFLHGAPVGGRRAVVLAAIDNMGKGAAGQAIQNMNVALGLPETAGLDGLAVYP